jgi:branched-chain amino acid transport system substrate-binding protein
MTLKHLAIAAVTLSVGLSACGGSDSDDATAGGSGGCDKGEPFKIGAVLPLSGPTAEGGKQTQAGIEIAVKDVNADGGILGRCAEVIYKDDQAEATRASQVTRDLVFRDEVEYVVGVINSSIIFPVSEVTGEADKVLVIGATDTVDYAENPYVFRAEVTVSEIAAKYVDYMKTELGLKRFGVLAVDDPYGQGVSDAIDKAAGGEGLEIVKTESFEPDALSLRSQISEIEGAGAEALVTVVYGQAAIVALESRADVGWTDTPVFGSNGFATKGIIDSVDSKALENLLVSPTYRRLNRDASGDISYKPAIEFRDKLKKRLGAGTLDDLMQQYVAGYDQVRLVASAVEEVGSSDAEEIKEHLESNPYDGVRAEYRFTAESHDGVPLEAVGMGIAKTLEDGTLEAASGER